ncbi:hypothetical protein [Pseudomonas fluorescens]|uniref:Uncharacterized protein n=1 Tax=Pseudomonas fluorescens TaxID=294 RepID=A0A5E7PAV1_PSEFL|nr:hypothetical protein [Pseudomonas fluorescens]VVP44563.1 hypothetical protein PS880_05026 [Pseudomonas fluorescens]
MTGAPGEQNLERNADLEPRSIPANDVMAALSKLQRSLAKKPAGNG